VNREKIHIWIRVYLIDCLCEGWDDEVRSNALSVKPLGKR
jgi:hypothetical protein